MRKIRIEWLAAALVVVVAVVLIILLVSTLHPNAHEADIRLPDSTEVADVNQEEIRPQEPDDGAQAVSLTTRNVQNVIATLQRPGTYSLLAEKVVSYGEESRVTRTEEWVTPDWRVTRTRDSLSENRICTRTENGRTSIWYEGQSRLLELGAASFDTPDQLAGMPSWLDVLALDTAAITVAEYRDWDGIPCIFVESYSDALGYSDRYYVSLSTGFLVYAETYTNGELVYSMHLLSWGEDVSEGAAVVPPVQ